jgi:hypothetical protein
MSQEVRGSGAPAPEPDWSQVRETVLMLELAAGQVEAAMKDSSGSVEVLTDTFTSLVDTLQHIDAAVDTLPDTIGNGLVKAEIQSNTQLVAAKVRQAIVAFQFHDKLAQRLDHVCQSLAGLSRLVSDRERLAQPAEWRNLQQDILAKYSMCEERAMFDAVLRGSSVREALDSYLAARQKKAGNGGEVELF